MWMKYLFFTQNLSNFADNFSQMNAVDRNNNIYSTSALTISAPGSGITGITGGQDFEILRKFSKIRLSWKTANFFRFFSLFPNTFYHIVLLISTTKNRCQVQIISEFLFLGFRGLSNHAGWRRCALKVCFKKVPSDWQKS